MTGTLSEVVITLQQTDSIQPQQLWAMMRVPFNLRLMIDNTSSISEDESSLNMYKLSVDLTDPRSQKLVWKYGASVQYITSDYTPTLGTTNNEDRFQTSLIPTVTSGLTPLAYVSAMGQIWKIRYSAGVNFQPTTQYIISAVRYIRQCVRASCN